jgi:hypothetical protein
MNNKRRRLTVMLVSLILLIALALGAAAPAAAVSSIEFGPNGIEVWDGMHGLLCPSAGGGSGT